jgi:AcrR family transcriptional regulator
LILASHLARIGGMPRAYGGVPAEQRRAQRRAALVAAGLEIIGSQGTDRLTVAGLCARARLNERYFYESFAGLEDVLTAVLDHVVGEVTTAIVAAVTSAPDEARAKARAAIGAAIETVTDDPRLSRVLFAEATRSPALMARRAATVRGFVGLIVEQATTFYGPAARLRAGALTEFAAAFLFGAIAESLMAWLRGDVAMSRTELVERSTELFVLVGEHVITATDPRAATTSGSAARRRPRERAR